MSHHLVRFVDVSFSYPDGTLALQQVSFTITHGESVGLVGANGAGKSTLVRHLNGCALPTVGRIEIGGLPLSTATRPEIRKRVGVVFQDPDDQLFMPRVLDDVAFGPHNLGLPPEVVLARVDAALAAVNCVHLKDKPPHHLSGGQKRAVAIAAVLAMEPDILVMDEPSADLDPRSRRHLIGQLRRFTHTKVVASHDLDLILSVCQRCLMLSEGRVVADGATVDLLTDQVLLERHQLELPLSLQDRAERRLLDCRRGAGQAEPWTDERPVPALNALER
jgi:cobalt/nickel transport system ATP-binding protein